MAKHPGQSNHKRWKDALSLAVNREGEDGKIHLHAIAERTVDLALEGHSWAIQEIGNRLDGKANQEQVQRIIDERPDRMEGMQLGRAILFALAQANAGSVINATPIPAGELAQKKSPLQGED